MFIMEDMTRATKKAKPLSLDALFRALSDPTRLRILNLVAGQEVCVCFFIGVLRLPQSKVSRHLAHLRAAGLLDARRDGKWMHYRLADSMDPAIRRLLHAVMDTLERNPAMNQDRAKLKLACCGPRSLVNTIGAPLPNSRPLSY